MSDIREEQIEALQVLKGYNEKLIKAVKEIAIELRGARQHDTDDFFKQIADGLNWEIQVVNGTLDYINEDEMLLDKNEFNAAVLRHNDAINSKDDEKVADSLEQNIYPYLIKLKEITDKKC